MSTDKNSKELSRSHLTPEQILLSRRYAFWEGSIGYLVLGIHRFIAPFAIFLGAVPFQLGLLAALHYLFNAFGQIQASRLVETLGSRKQMVTRVVLLSTIPWALMALIPFLPGSSQVWSLIILAGVAVALMAMLEPAWGSWISDLVPSSKRGKFLATRLSVATLFTFTFSLIIAALLDRLADAVLWGFIGLFTLAFNLRLISFVFFSRMSDPQTSYKSPESASSINGLWSFTRNIHRSNLGAFTIYILLLYFGMGLMAPFYALYMIRDLGLSYLTYMGLNAAMSITAIIFLPLWGYLADKYGNLRMLRFASPSYVLMPIALLISSDPLYLLGIHALLGMWAAGFSVLAINFVYESSNDNNRTSNIGYFNALSHLFLFVASITSGLIVSLLPQIFNFPVMSLFLISAVIRIIATLALLPRVREIR